MEECFKCVEKVVNEYLPEIVLSLKKNPAAREALKEICDLLADIVEIANIEIPRNYRVEEVMNFCTLSTLMMIVRPAMDHVLAAYVSGAYPLCYQPIRISTEALAYSLYVDMEMPLVDESVFLEKLLMFQKDLEKKQIKMSKLIEDLSNVVGEGLSRKMMKIWSKTSNDFLHFKGYLDKMLRWNSDNLPPSYLVGSFVEYNHTDEPYLEGLKKIVEEFRELLKGTWSFWKSWYDKQTT